MNKFAVLLICIQICFIKTTLCQCINSVPNPTGGPFGYNHGYSDVFYGPSPLDIAAAYGGVGEGNVEVIGELPVSGTTIVTGQVPIMGAVSFQGPVPAFGVVSIAGNCACSCSAGGSFV